RPEAERADLDVPRVIEVAEHLARCGLLAGGAVVDERRVAIGADRSRPVAGRLARDGAGGGPCGGRHGRARRGGRGRGRGGGGAAGVGAGPPPAPGRIREPGATAPEPTHRARAYPAPSAAASRATAAGGSASMNARTARGEPDSQRSSASISFTAAANGTCAG